MTIKCRKRPYTATAIQWGGENFDQVCDMLESIDCTADLYGVDKVMIRSNIGIETLNLGDWVVQGENLNVKTYTDQEFQTKYEQID